MKKRGKLQMTTNEASQLLRSYDVSNTMYQQIQNNSNRETQRDFFNTNSDQSENLVIENIIGLYIDPIDKVVNLVEDLGLATPYQTLRAFTLIKKLETGI